jgi:Fe-S oxidoreductase
MSIENRITHIEQCSRCSQCKFVPMPASKAFSSICPSVDYKGFHAYSAGGKLITAYALYKKMITPSQSVIESIYSCTMCGACDVSCKTNMGDNVEPLDSLFAIRAELASKGLVPEKFAKIIQLLKSEGSCSGRREDRSKWAEGLAIADAREQKVDVLIHVGSENAYNKNQWGTLRFIVGILERANIKAGIVFDSESDSGGLAYDLGFQAIAREMAEEWRAHVLKSGAQIVLAADAEAYSAFKNIYPRLGCMTLVN